MARHNYRQAQILDLRKRVLFSLEGAVNSFKIKEMVIFPLLYYIPNRYLDVMVNESTTIFCGLDLNIDKLS